MKRNNIENNRQLKEVAEKILKTVLFVDANTASCTLMHQPEAPSGLSKYSRTKNEKK